MILVSIHVAPSSQRVAPKLLLCSTQIRPMLTQMMSPRYPDQSYYSDYVKEPLFQVVGAFASLPTANAFGARYVKERVEPNAQNQFVPYRASSPPQVRRDSDDDEDEPGYDEEENISAYEGTYESITRFGTKKWRVDWGCSTYVEVKEFGLLGRSGGSKVREGEAELAQAEEEVGRWWDQMPIPEPLCEVF